MGRKLLYDEGIGEQLIELIAGGISGGLQGACQKLDIPRSTVRSWGTSVPAFGAKLAQARLDGCDVIADQIIQIADEVEGCTDNAQVSAAKLRVDARRWILSKLRPEQYGDRVEISGNNGRDLLASHEANIPRLLQVLSILLPGTSNSELFTLATQMSQKLRALEGPKANGEDQD
jgi:hypothetical protein